MDQKNDNRPPVGHTTKRFLDWVNADENLPSIQELEHDHHDESHDDDHGASHAHEEHGGHPGAEPVVTVEVIQIDEELLFPDPLVEEDLTVIEVAPVTQAEDHGLYTPERHGTAEKKSKRGRRPGKRRKSNITGSRFFYVFIGALLSLVIIATLVLTVSYLPPFGSPENPTVANNEVYEKYIEDGQADTGAVNVVAAMILDYRAFDTLGESVMLFTATMAVIMLIREANKGKAASDDRRKEEA